MTFDLPPETWASGCPLEIWADIPGYPNYQASNYGEIRSLDHWVEQRPHPRGGRGVLRRHLTGRILRQHLSTNGYAQVGSGGTRRRHLFVHQAVALAFLGPCPEGKEVAHGPAGKRDNSLANLSYKTHAENQGPDKVRDGTDGRGEKNSQAKLTATQVAEIRALYDSERHLPRRGNHGRTWTLAALAARYGVDQSVISHIVRGERWS